MRLLVLSCVLVSLSVSCVCSQGVLAAPTTDDIKAGKMPERQGSSGQVASPINTIVFIDKQNACECTQVMIKSGWKALQAALKDRKDIHVTRIHYDTERPLAERYLALKPLMALPGIYFLNARGGVVELLQGEVRPEQIVAVFKKPPAS
jgi:hypothetical protein